MRPAAVSSATRHSPIGVTGQVEGELLAGRGPFDEEDLETSSLVTVAVAEAGSSPGFRPGSRSRTGISTPSWSASQQRGASCAISELPPPHRVDLAVLPSIVI